jgi:hypothetical protein
MMVLLQEGIHDWMHFLGTSKLEWAVLLTDIQRAVRKYVNPAFTISFDCASHRSWPRPTDRYIITLTCHTTTSGAIV